MFDQSNQLYKRTVTVTEVRNAPIVNFKNGVDTKKLPVLEFLSRLVER